MSINSKYFLVAKRRASLSYKEVIDEYSRRFHRMDKRNVGDKHYIYEETSRLVDLIKSTKFSDFLEKEYYKLYEQVGVDRVKVFLDSQSLLNPFYYFSLKNSTAKKFLRDKYNQEFK